MHAVFFVFHNPRSRITSSFIRVKLGGLHSLWGQNPERILLKILNALNAFQNTISKHPPAYKKNDVNANVKQVHART